MDYQYFADKIGAKFDIVEGKLTESENGQFTVSETFGNFVIYLNKLNKTANIIVPQKAYVGRSYRLRYTDCITLFAEWLDDHYGSGFGNIYTKLSNKEFYRYYTAGMGLWYEDNGFTKVTSPETGDSIVYEHAPNVISHVGIYVGDDKILHHMPKKLSCIDSLDYSKIIGIYRYG